MKFSILIAHYNNWNYFQECYKSIQDQTYQDFEIVIVDDCSTDDSFQKLEELSLIDSKIKLFQNKENKQVGYTKRRCVEEACGEFCLFVDPDDKISSTSLEDIRNVYNLHPTIIATYSKLDLMDNHSNYKADFNLTKKVKNSDQKFFNINFEVAHLFSFKKNVYLFTDGINEELSSAVDQDLYMKLYEKGEFYFINKIQYHYRIHDKGVSQDQSKKRELSENWHQVLLETCNRRNITKLYGKEVSTINNLPNYIYQKENTILNKIKRKLGW